MLCKNSLMDCICCFENIYYEKMTPPLAMIKSIEPRRVPYVQCYTYRENPYINPTLVLTRPPPKFRNTCPLLPLTC